jgi:nitrogenase-stabilizing/protective protein
MSESTLLKELAELEAAEDFLNYFSIPFEPSVVQVNRLHILQRFHDYLHELGDAMPKDEQGRQEKYAACLNRAYQDFVHSNAQTEKVFKVFHRTDQPQQVCVPLDRLFR